MRKHILVLAGLLLIGRGSAYAQGVTKVGTTAAAFLGIDVGPRGTGMGGAQVSLSGDATAMYWNPAGIARLKGFEAAFCNSKWIADLSFNYAGVVFGLGNAGSVGLQAVFLGMDQMERTTILQPEGTGEFFDAGSYAVGLSYARNLTNQFSIGFSGKYVNERMYHCGASGFGFDVGALFNTAFHGLTLGMSISNYGTKMQLDGRDLQVQHDVDVSVSGNNSNINARLETDRFDLPLMFRVGVSMDMLKGRYDSNLTLSMDALHPSDDSECLNAGGEYIWHKLLSLRAGYKGIFAKDAQQGLSFGGGVRYGIQGRTLLFDYSYMDFMDLNPVNMFSVGLAM